MTDSINFRKGEFACTREREEAKRTLTFTAVLAALILALLIGNLSFRYMNLAREMAATRENLRASYRDLFPQGGTVVDELYQLEGKYQEVSGKLEVIGSGMNPLEVLRRVAEAGKEGGVTVLTLDKLSMGQGRVTARGEVDSFESATRLRDVLRGSDLFSEVTLTNVTAGANGRTNFSLSMGIK